MRLLERFPMKLREEIVVFEPPERMEYTLLSGMPLRDYRAEVTLSPDGDGTEIDWRSEFDALPGVGRLPPPLPPARLRGHHEERGPGRRAPLAPRGEAGVAAANEPLAWELHHAVAFRGAADHLRAGMAP